MAVAPMLIDVPLRSMHGRIPYGKQLLLACHGLFDFARDQDKIESDSNFRGEVLKVPVRTRKHCVFTPFNLEETMAIKSGWVRYRDQIGYVAQPERAATPLPG